MEITEVVDRVLTELGWNAELCMNPNRHKRTIRISAFMLINSIISTDTINDGATFTGCSYKVLNTCVERNLVPKLGILNGGKETWNFALTNLVRVKKCPSCNILKSYDDYHLDSNNPRGINHECKICRVTTNAVNYKKPATLECHKRSYEKNKAAIKARNAQYRADRLLRYPAWADLVKIALIYKNCPIDSQVDHIIPLKGKLVSGLHVETNLQYLPKLDNLSKNNSFDIEKFNNGEVWYATEVQPSEKIRYILSGTIKPNSLVRITKVCPVCSLEFIVKESKEHQECCSKSCAGKLFQLGKKTEDKLNTSKDVIEKLIWDKPFSVGCKDVSLSDNGLRKMAVRMKCIMPPDRYHTKSIADKKRIREETFKGASGAAG